MWGGGKFSFGRDDCLSLRGGILVHHGVIAFQAHCSGIWKRLYVFLGVFSPERGQERVSKLRTT